LVEFDLVGGRNRSASIIEEEIDFRKSFSIFNREVDVEGVSIESDSTFSFLDTDTRGDLLADGISESAVGEESWFTVRSFFVMFFSKSPGF